MKAPGKGLLKTVSILFIIGGAIFTISSLFSIYGSTKMGSPEFSASLPAGVDPSMFDQKNILVNAILLLIGSLLDLVFGILGVRKSGDPEKSDFFFTAGVILCGLSVVSLYIGYITSGFNLTSLVPFILPILFIIGSLINRKAATAAEAAAASGESQNEQLTGKK